MLSTYKNITITSMSFDPDIVKGTIDNQKFTADIKTDSKGQYIIIKNQKIYLSEFKVY